MSVRSEVLLWAQRVLARGTSAAAHVLLEVKSDASFEEAQDAFHKIARTSHPDLHRASLTPDELELVTSAYSRIASAYQDFRTKHSQTTRLRPMKDDPPPVGERPASRTPSGMKPIQRTPTMQGTGVGSPSPSQAAPGAPGPMNNKALIYYRKAELCLRQGDLKTAVLNMKMAIAGDPQSTFLRTALAEIESEIGKK